MPTSEVQMQNLLDSITDSILNSHEEISAPEELDDFIGLIYQLKDALVSQSPSEDFINDLKQQLIRQEEGVLKRLGYTPGRVQVAAGVALIAGFMLLIRRRLTGEGDEERADIPVLQR